MDEFLKTVLIYGGLGFLVGATVKIGVWVLAYSLVELKLKKARKR